MTVQVSESIGLTRFPTLEVRWFFKGLIPLVVKHWYAEVALESLPAPRRVDYYLCLTDTDTVGFKLREGRVEVKQRTASQGVTQFHDRVTGRVESWCKWSFPIAADDRQLLGLVSADLDWIPVEKQRQLGRFSVSPAQISRNIPAQEPLQSGCDLELAQIYAFGQEWWSVAFEAFGLTEKLQSTLAAVVDHVFGRQTPPRLPLQASFSYPHWLMSLDTDR